MMNKIKQVLILLIGALFIVNCQQKKEKVKLDINAYLAVASSDNLSPIKDQIQMLKAIIPEDAFKLVPPIVNRAYWNGIALTHSGKKYLEDSILDIKIEPEVPITDSIYRLANKQGNRGIYKPRYYRTMTRLEHFMLAECIENQTLKAEVSSPDGEFIIRDEKVPVENLREGGPT
jgi:hypothetical protein